MDLIKEQRLICSRFGAQFQESPDYLKIGASSNIGDHIYPINGLRHRAQGDTTGWYIWAGEYSTAPDFFEPIHIEHLKQLCPQVMKYLGLAAGWRFLVAPGYEDVWQDTTILHI